MSALRSPTPAVQSQRSAVVRTARVSSPTGDFRLDAIGTLTLTAKGVATDYPLERISSSWGDAFRLTKHVGAADEECPVYDVNLADEGCTCECLGFLRHGHCKHVESLKALRNANRI